MSNSTTLILPGAVRDLAKRLLLAKAHDVDHGTPRGRAVFWIGAGASVSAGVPSGRSLAGHLACHLALRLGCLPEPLDEDAPDAHARAFSALQEAQEIARDLTLGTAYGDLFARLDATQQRDFIRRVILKTNRRQINWAHLAIGELVRQRVVHTVLTTNFDDLLLDGLVRSDQLPAIIDGVESLNRLDPRPPVPQLVYLHGSQHTYSPRNSTEAVVGTRDITQALGGLFGVLQQCSVLTVVGYAGNPGEGVMEMLVKACSSLPELPIYWVAHGQQDSLSEDTKLLLRHGTKRRLIAGQDADLFFRELLREMRIGVPVWFREPVEHLLDLARRICVSTSAESSELRDEVDDFRERLGELLPVWQTVGAANLERRELRQLMLRDGFRDVWLRLKDRDLDKVELLQMRADAAYELGLLGLEDSLPQAASDWRAVLSHLSYGSSHWALAQKRLADTLATLGKRGDEQAMKGAIAAYSQALEVRTRKQAPTEWAATRSNQGLALLTLGEWGDTLSAMAALEAFTDALKVYTRDAMPAEWARTNSNLANAFQVIGKVESGDASWLENAVQTYAQALEVQTRDRMPHDWAITTCNRASALLTLGQQGHKRSLRDAVHAFDDALQVFTRDVYPTTWATIRNNQGAALLTLGQHGDEQALRGAINAFREALEVRGHKAMAADWATTSNNLGNALLALGMQGDEQALHEAMDILSAAMEPLTGELYPKHHTLDIVSLAQRVFDELWRVAVRQAPEIPGMSVGRVQDTVQHRRAGPRANPRVLVVEDSEYDRELIRVSLEKCVIDVHFVVDGASALQAVNEFKPDLLVLDLGLPDMAGQDVLSELKKSHPKLPVLVYSADTDAMTQLKKQQPSSVSQLLTILPKEGSTEAFKRLVPTLFRRRESDFAGRPADRLAAEAPA